MRSVRAVMMASSCIVAPVALSLVLALAATTLDMSPAFADGGNSGDGSAGGADSATGTGGNGTTGTGFVGGGGGGAGVTGGSGGSSGNAPGGGGGSHGWVGASLPTSASAGSDGGNGSYNSGGGGAGGGAGGYGAVVTGSGDLGTLSSAVTGGNGGNAGPANNGYTGGGGGSGGIGLLLTATGVSLTNASTITGGNGGAGGAGNTGNASGPGGLGGAGGTGFSASGATLTNTGTITGGNGGAQGANLAGDISQFGLGGAGIVGSDLTVINSGTISGGNGGDGFTQANAITFTSGTNILEIQAGSIISGNVVAASTADTLRLGGSTDASFDVSQIGASAQYQGFGYYAKTGTSKWTLTGTNSDTMAWTVDAGTLSVNGSMAASSFTVGSGGTLGGNGTVGDVTVNGGTLSPGNSIGLLTISGSLTLTAASTYLVEVSPTSADRVNVAGTATLGGATVSAVFASGSYIAKQYTIVNATGGVSGTFGTLATTNLPSGFTSALSYGANNVYLNLTLSYTPTVTSPTDTSATNATPSPSFSGGLTGNQQRVANALVNSFNTVGGIPMIFGALNANGLSQASGEMATGNQQVAFNANSQFMGAMFDVRPDGGAATGAGMSSYAEDALSYRERARRGTARDAFASLATKAPAADPFATRWSAWAEGTGGTQTVSGNAASGTATSNSRIAGATVGVDVKLGTATTLGFAMGGGGSSYNLSDGSGGGRSDLFQTGIYGRHIRGNAYVAGALAYGWQDVTTDRTVLGTALTARYNTHAVSGRLEGGYRFATPLVGLTPYAAAQFTTLFLPDYRETGTSSTFALAYAGRDITSPRTELGLRADRSFAMQSAILTLRGRAAWAHDYNTDRSVTASFQALQASSFVVNGATPAKDAALITAQAETRWTNGISLVATFDSELSNTTESYVGRGMVRYQW